MSNESLLLVEDTSLFSPISQLNYEFYTDQDKLATSLKERQDLQCIAGNGFTLLWPDLRIPSLTDYADGVDTLNSCQVCKIQTISFRQS